MASKFPAKPTDGRTLATVYRLPGVSRDPDLVASPGKSLDDVQPGNLPPSRDPGERRLSDKLRRLDAVLAHELRQPLFTIRMASENLSIMAARPELDRALLQKSVSRIAEQVARAQAIIESTLARAITDAASDSSCDVAGAAIRSLDFLSELFASMHVTAERSGADVTPRSCAGPVEMEQVFVNLLKNAVESIARRRRGGWEGQGRISVSVEVHDDHVCCEVSDNGAGVGPDGTAHLFEPFARAAPEHRIEPIIGPGVGLGLHVCKDIVARAGGKIELVPGQAEGAVARFKVPLLG